MQAVARKFCFSIALFGLVTLQVWAQPTTEAGDVSPAELPPFVVTEVQERLPWRHGTFGDLEILTLCSDSISRSVVDAVLRGRGFIPETLLRARSKKTTIILFDQKAAMERGAPAKASATEGNSAIGDGTWRSISGRIIVSDSSSLVFAANLPSRREWVSVDFGVVARALAEDTPACAPWVYEGLFGLAGGMNFGAAEDSILLPKMVWMDHQRTVEFHRNPDRPVAMLGFEEFFNPAPRTDKSAEWRAQAALFARWALYGDKSMAEMARGYWQLAYLSKLAPTTEANFEACFGMSYQMACERMQRFLPVTSARQMEISMPGLSKSPTRAKGLKFTKATSEQIGRLKAEWERLEARTLRSSMPELANKYVGAARSTLERAVKAGGNNAALSEIAGLLEFEAGRLNEARNHLEFGYSSGTYGAPALLALSKLRAAGSVNGQLKVANPTAKERILAPLIAAANNHPALWEAHDLLATSLLASPRLELGTYLPAIAKGCEAYPMNPSYLLKAAQVFRLSGNRRDAGVIAKRAAILPMPASMRAEFAKIIDGVDN